MFPSNNFTFENNTLGLEAITTRYIFENCPSLSLSNQPDDLLADKRWGIGLPGTVCCQIALPITRLGDCQMLNLSSVFCRSNQLGSQSFGSACHQETASTMQKELLVLVPVYCNSNLLRTGNKSYCSANRSFLTLFQKKLGILRVLEAWEWIFLCLSCYDLLFPLAKLIKTCVESTQQGPNSGCTVYQAILGDF